ncbi:hypothetical protein QE152_g5132 [Popillia japonica]|uniref:Uncharacterized protein n=1 Tax=Popillia japonica TaxID=7064 RepID=A0AAW1MX70_POPJA
MSDITDVEKRDKLLENVRVSLQGRPPTTLKYITDVEKRDKLLENVRVSLQGRPPTTLKYLTDGNKALIKTFSTMDVMKLMKPRNLYLKPSCLDGSNNLAFFIKDPNCTNESTMEAPYETGDNIAINCHPDDIDEQIEMFKNKFEYDDYII